MKSDICDVIIIGGGAAGLSAALVLGRCRRKVLILDEGKPRNRFAKEMHGYLSRDGIPPLKFLEIANEDLQKYDIEKVNCKVENINKLNNHFEIITDKEIKYYSKKILLATGKVDKLPPIPGIKDMYGISVHHCPYCDGWEEKNRRIAVLAKGNAAFDLSKALQTWSDKVMICSNGNSGLSISQKENLGKHGIKVYQNKIKYLEGENGKLKKIYFKSDEFIECDSLFFSTGQKIKDHFAEKFGCKVAKNGLIVTDKKQRTNVKGIFAAGDATLDVNFVIVAAAEGAKAAVSINMELQDEIQNIIESKD